MELGGGLFLVKFGELKDRERILNSAPWSFDQHIFSMVSYVKDKELGFYVFSVVPFL